MRKITPLILSLTLTLVSCKSYSISPEYKLDTSNPIHTKIVIFVSPTSDEIKKLKSINEEDFYTIADDINYYNAKAWEYLEKNNIPYKLTKEKKFNFIVNNKSTEYDYSKSKQAWFIIIYNGKDKPLKGFSIDINKHIKSLK